MRWTHVITSIDTGGREEEGALVFLVRDNWWMMGLSGSMMGNVIASKICIIVFIIFSPSKRFEELDQIFKSI